MSGTEDTRSLFGLTHDDEDTHKDCLPSRIKRDHSDLIKLVELVSLATGDVAS